MRRPSTEQFKEEESGRAPYQIARPVSILIWCLVVWPGLRRSGTSPHRSGLAALRLRPAARGRLPSVRYPGTASLAGRRYARRRAHARNPVLPALSAYRKSASRSRSPRKSHGRNGTLGYTGLG